MITYKCPNCEGNSYKLELETGKIYEVQFKFPNSIKCNFCKGKKELDWIENVFGVEGIIKLKINKIRHGKTNEFSQIIVDPENLKIYDNI